GFNDVDGIGALILNGAISAGAGTTLNLTAVQDITLGGAALNFPTSTVNITSTQGGIIDGNDPPVGTNNVTATTLNLSAARGIGSGPGANNPLEVTVATLSAVNTVSGDVQVVNLSGNLSVSGSNTGGGPFTITVQQAGAVLTVNAGNIASGGGAINLTADDMTLTGTVSAGAGIVTLQPTTLSRPIDLGTNSAGATLGLTDAELDRVTTTTALRVG